MPCYYISMSKLRLPVLVGIIVVEIIVIAGLLVWAIVGGDTKRQPSSKQRDIPTQGYNTPKIEPKLIARGLEQPTDIAATPDTADKRLFIVEQAGVIRIVNANGTLQDKPLLDIKAKVQHSGEMGLLGLTFHPKFQDNGHFFINYVDKARNTIIARYTISQQTGLADSGSEKVLLKVAQPYPNHKGGALAFGPDGYLYIALGDGGSGGDPENRAQNKKELLGKILRIDIDQDDSYAIPPDNPFANAAGAKPEIWALGLRNPWRISFDRQTGELYIADVGQNALEEINMQPKGKGGANYGWRCYEASQTYNTTGCQDASTYTMPVLQYDRGDGRCSITGGAVYRGSNFPALLGSYFYTDYCSGQMYYAKNVSGTWTAVLATTVAKGVTTYGQDSQGELYFANANSGELFRVEDTANP
jgi:glucose/arabinose dehydrogenase